MYFKKVALEDGQNMTENMIQVPENRKGVNIFITLIGPDWVKMRSFKNILEKAPLALISLSAVIIIRKSSRKVMRKASNSLSGLHVSLG